MIDDITIRPAASIADYRACQEAQRRAWGIEDVGYVVPIATMVGAQLHGGLVLGAFVPDGKAVGVSFAFLGRSEGPICLYSQLTGVDPDYQDRGLGGRLKEAQRVWARGQGIATIAWAFDPLRAGNARFNLDKLGAVAVRYIEDMYGPRTDALNLHTPTDRLIVHWATIPAGPPTPIEPDAARILPRMIVVEDQPGGPLAPVAVRHPSAPQVLLEIPDDIGRLRSDDAPLAERWRLAVKQGFLAAFAAGYRATGFIRWDDRGRRRGFYRLQRPD
jgi:predicted GNAT superfamily acetyltransferase